MFIQNAKSAINDIVYTYTKRKRKEEKEKKKREKEREREKKKREREKKEKENIQNKTRANVRNHETQEMNWSDSPPQSTVIYRHE